MKKPLSNKTVVVIAAGEIRDYKFFKPIIRKADFIICADSGYAHARKFKVSPDLIIGDMDSSRFSEKGFRNKKLKFKKYPKEKDQSDCELAVAWAVKLGSKDIKVIGGLGKRIDHSLANIFVAGKYPGRVTLIDEYAELSVHDKSFTIKAKKDDTISLLAFFSKVNKINGSRLKYLVNDLSLEAGSLGISNVATGSNPRINFKKGKILCIRVVKP